MRLNVPLITARQHAKRKRTVLTAACTAGIVLMMVFAIAHSMPDVSCPCPPDFDGGTGGEVDCVPPVGVVS